MYSKTLKPEIMRTMLPPDFPAEKLSRPQYKVIVERDVMMTMRDGTQIACNIHRPDAPGRFPAIHAADSYQKDLDHLPLLPIFHMRETNDIEYYVSRGPTSSVFKKGHHIRVDVAYGDSPALDLGGHYYGIKVGTDTYYHDAERPSHVILPVIPAK